MAKTFLLTDHTRPGAIYAEPRRIREFARHEQDDRFAFGARELWYLAVSETHGPVAALALALDTGR